MCSLYSSVFKLSAYSSFKVLACFSYYPVCFLEDCSEASPLSSFVSFNMFGFSSALDFLLGFNIVSLLE